MAVSVLDPEARHTHVTDTAHALRDMLDDVPRIGIIAGAGTHALLEGFREAASIAFAEIPHMPGTNDEAERYLQGGTLHGQDVLVLPTPLHVYEGATAHDVAFPVRVMGELGIDTVLMAHPAGGVNPHLAPGDAMLISDHINLQGVNPLEGPNIDEWGPRFPDMTDPYHAALRTAAHEAATDAGTRLHDGVYLGVPGPNLQTTTEYRFMEQIGADAVGTGLISEVIAARHMDLRVLAWAVITDACFADNLAPAPADDVADAATQSATRIAAVLERLLPQL